MAHNELTDHGVPVLRKFQLIWVSVFSAVSFAAIQLINYLTGSYLYDRIKDIEGSMPPSELAFHEGFKHCFFEWRVSIRTLHQNYEKLTPLGLTVLGIILVVISVCIGLVMFAGLKSNNWKSDATCSGFYLIATWLISIFIYRDVSGTLVAAVIYVILIFVMRGIGRFKPHHGVSLKKAVDRIRFREILKIYGQYMFISWAVIGFVPSSYLGVAHQITREMYFIAGHDGEVLYTAVVTPYMLAQIAFSVIGTVALAFGCIRELHFKQREMLASDSPD